MLPLHIDPALVLSGPPRFSGGQPNPLVLTPGEAVQATVLAVPDEGALLILVKGAVLQASSLVGRLAVGQVLDARVEVRDGQTLLRLDQPVTLPGVSGIRAQPGQLDAGPADAAGQVRLAALLKHLLPSDGPLAGGLARLADSLARAVEQGHLPPQTLAGFEAIRRQVLLEGQEGGGAVPAAKLVQVLQTLGLSHEHDLLAAINSQGSVPAGWEINLKSWLIKFLAIEPDPPPPPQPDSTPRPDAGPAVTADPPVSARTVSTLPGSSREPMAPKTDAAGAAETGDPAIRGIQERFPASRPSLALFLPADEAGESVPLDGSGQERPGLRRGTDVVIREPVPEGARPAGREPHDQAAPSLVSKETPEQMQEQEPDPAPRQSGPAGLFPRSAASAATQAPLGLTAAAMKRLAEAPGPAAVSGEATSAATGSPEPAWIRDAQHLLSIIERTQALSGLNAQTGQPVCFDFPLAWGGQGQARIYVDTGEAGGQGHASQPRPYRVVTLLDLDGLGAIRVDTVLTGKRLAARFLLDQPQVEAAVAARLPALSRSLSAKGYQVDVITSGTAGAELVRGADLEAKAAPRVSLVNCRA